MNATPRELMSMLSDRSIKAPTQYIPLPTNQHRNRESRLENIGDPNGRFCPRKSGSLWRPVYDAELHDQFVHHGSLHRGGDPIDAIKENTMYAELMKPKSDIWIV